jgi:hypothetical protein
MKKHLSLFFASLLTFAAVCLPLISPYSASGALPVQDKFQPGCTLPFDAIKLHHPIDHSCRNEGKANPTLSPGQQAANELQNQAKNNFCAPAPAIPVIMHTFDLLQVEAQNRGVSFGNQFVTHPNPLPEDRSALRDVVNVHGSMIGEGTLVVLEAFIIEAHRADTGGGEGVNCNQSGAANNDIHIAIGTFPTDPTCRSVTAEISPHFRPEAWEKIISQRQAFLDELFVRKVRITGQLMFDASHSPCGHPAHVQSDPARRSLWEIHPVYKVEIQDGAGFIPFEDFVSNQ